MNKLLQKLNKIRAKLQSFKIAIDVEEANFNTYYKIVIAFHFY